MSLSFTVRGIPAPQGSKRHVGGGVMVESSKRLRPWRDAVRADAVAALAKAGIATPERFDGPLVLEVTFYFARPKSHYRTGENAHLLRLNAPVAPQGPPDLSKLVRSTEDALTDAGVWVDDSRVVLCFAGKKYCHPATVAHPGAVIVVRSLMEATANG